MIRIRIKGKRVVAGILASAFGVMSIVMPCGMASAFSFIVSPMSQKIILNPGDTFSSSFKVYNPASETSDIKYEVTADSWYVDEKYNNVFGEETDRNAIMKWTKLDSSATGVLKPNETTSVSFTISVPSDAPAGGQYMALKVRAKAADEKDDSTSNSGSSTNAGINENYVMSHTIFAEVTGDSQRKGEVVDLQVPSFLLSGPVQGTGTVRNTGNVHGTAKYKLQVFPLFSNEEIYTNEEEPAEYTVLPDRARTEVINWDKTPMIGIFNVVFTVEFEGVTAQASKMVIKCPVWLLFVILFAIASLIIWIVLRVKARKKTAAHE